MAPEQVELWLVDPRVIEDPGLLEAYRQLLGDDERERLAAIGIVGGRFDFLVGRALIRTTLSRRYLQVELARWRFELGP